MKVILLLASTHLAVSNKRKDEEDWKSCTNWYTIEDIKEGRKGVKVYKLHLWSSSNFMRFCVESKKKKRKTPTHTLSFMDTLEKETHFELDTNLTSFYLLICMEIKRQALSAYISWIEENKQFIQHIDDDNDEDDSGARIRGENVFSIDFAFRID